MNLPMVLLFEYFTSHCYNTLILYRAPVNHYTDIPVYTFIIQPAN